MKKIVFLVAISLCAGCTLEAVIDSQVCPPDGNGQAYVFTNGARQLLNSEKCPESAPTCMQFVPESADAKIDYFCHSNCGNKIPCNGGCVDESDPNYEACLVILGKKDDCRKNTHLCSESETCDTRTGLCLTEPEDISCEGKCGSEGKCNEGECIDRNTGVPLFCKDPATIEFLSNKYANIHRISGLTDHSEACRQRIQFDEALAVDGSSLCNTVDSCFTGSVASFYKCIDWMIEQKKASNDSVPDYIDADVLGNLLYLQNACEKCGDVYCLPFQKCEENQCVHMTCDEYPPMCGGETCWNSQCYAADDDGNVRSNASPLFCEEASVSSYFESHIDLLITTTDTSSYAQQCTAIKELREDLASIMPELCAQTASCSKLDDDMFASCGQLTLLKALSGHVDVNHYIDISNVIAYLNILKTPCNQCSDGEYCPDSHKCDDLGHCIKRTCSEYGDNYADMCSIRGECIENECINKTTGRPMFCDNYIPWNNYIASHRTEIETFAALEEKTDDAKCALKQKFDGYYASEFGAVCEATTACSVGSIASYYSCLAKYAADENFVEVSELFDQMGSDSSFCQPDAD